MLKTVVSIILVSIGSHTLATQSPSVGRTLVDYLKDTPASLTGVIAFENPVTLTDSDGVSTNIVRARNQDDGMFFNLTENGLSIDTTRSLEVRILGMPLRIRHIQYDRTTGQFNVRTDTPLGIGSRELNARLQQELHQRFSGKMARAFAELDQIRRQNSVRDISAIARSITGIFSDGRSHGPPPSIYGDLSLNFNPPRDQVLNFGNLDAHIRQGDTLSARLSFRAANGRASVSDLEFSSSKGIRFYQRGSTTHELSVHMSSVRFSPWGVNSNFNLGVEDTVDGIGDTVGIIAGLINRNPNSQPCSSAAMFQRQHDQIEAQLRQAIRVQVQQHRAELERLGIEARTLDAAM